MKIKTIILACLSVCLIVTTAVSIAEGIKTKKQVLMLPSKAKGKLTKPQLEKIQTWAEEENIPVVQAATLPAPGKLICGTNWVGTLGVMTASTWLCDVEYSCPQVMVAAVVDSSTGASTDCEYDCGGQPTPGTFYGASCDCTLQAGQPSICPQ